MYIYLHKEWQSYESDDEIVSSAGNSYEIGDRIGAGGNGAVYECIDGAGNVLAVKFLLQKGEKIKKRFEQEISLMQRLNHPHIIRYIDHGVVELINPEKKTVSCPFVVMEKADKNLIDYLRDIEKVEYEIYAGQFRGLCQALEEMHQYAIHRDIKPENILVKGEKWVLSDFGLCELLSSEEHQDITAPNEKVGPRFWMSPEAVNNVYFGNDSIGKYSDVFQLCSVFIFILTKRYPGGIFLDTDNFNTTPEITKLLLRSLSNNYRNRPADGHELALQYDEATYLAK